MKKSHYHLPLLLLILASFIFLGCEKATPETTYTFRDNAGMYEQIQKNIDESGTSSFVKCTLTFHFFEYNEQKMCIAQRSVEKVSKGSPKKFTANDDTKFVTVMYYLHLENTETGKSSTQKRYVSNIFSLKPGENTDITITENTIMLSYEPI